MEKRRKFILPSLLLSLAIVLSSCSAGEEPQAETEGAALQRAAVMPSESSDTVTTASETTTLQMTTTTETSILVTLPEIVTIATTPAPSETVSPVATAAEITQLTAPEITTVAPAAFALVTTSAQTTAVSEPIQQKLSPLTSTYTYNNLNSDQKIIYSKLLTAIKSHTELVSLDSPASLDTVTQIYKALYQEEVSLQFISDSFKYDADPVRKMQISYTLSKDTINSINTQTEARVSEILSKITPTMTSFDIVKYFHDTIIKNCTYTDSGEYVSTAYGALVRGQALCQGYAHAMALLCNRVGIENALVTGYAREPHMWNKIKLNGQWYNLDVTWDDPDSDTVPGLVLYDYFNVPDSELSSRQLYTSYVPLPAAAAWESNYFVNKSLVANSLEQARQIVYNECIRAVNNREKYIAVKCADTQVYNQAVENLVTNMGVFSVMAQAKGQTTNAFNAGTTNLIRNDETRTLYFVLSYS